MPLSSVRAWFRPVKSRIVPTAPPFGSAGLDSASRDLVTEEPILKHAALLAEAYEKEYKEIAETWRDLERKAQISLATAGLFLTPAFNQLDRFRPRLSSGLEALLLFGALASVAGAVIAGAWSLWTRDYDEPPFVKHASMVQMLLINRDGMTLQEYIARLSGEMRHQWGGPLESVRDGNDTKANALAHCHRCLFAAATAMVILGIARVGGVV